MLQGIKLIVMLCTAGLFLFPGHPGTFAGGAGPDVLGVVDQSGRFTAFVAALQEADLAEMLKGKGPFTLFAPTDEAFAKVPRATLDALLNDKTRLRKLLLHHLVAGRLSSPEILNKRTVRAYDGRGLRTSMKGKLISIENASIISADLPAENGVVHAIDAVLMPPAKE